MTGLVREYEGEGDFLSVDHADTSRARGNAPGATALMQMAGASGGVGDILFS